MTRVGHPGILKSVFALLLLNIFVHGWAAVTNLPLPLGRPSAIVCRPDGGRDRSLYRT